MKQTFLTLGALLAASASLLGAQPWTLEQCVDYGLSHNISLRQTQIAVEQGRQSLVEAKDAFLPQVNASVSQSFNFGRGLTSDNTYANRNTSSFQWGAQLSLPLFQGMRDWRQLRASRSQLQQLLAEAEAAADDVTLNIISQYLQVLYAKEVAAGAHATAQLSDYQVGRQQALYDQGKVAEAVVWDAQAQASQDHLTAVNADNEVSTSLVNLANLLQLTGEEARGLDVAPLEGPDPILPSVEAVYQGALAVNNSLMASRQAQQVARDNVSVAASGYLPRLSFQASTGSSYYHLAGATNEPFGRQMNHNFSTYLGLSLSIPIFDAFSTRNAVRTARLRLWQAQTETDQRLSDLYKTIQLAHTQALGAFQSYTAATETLEKTRLSFEATNEKYALGRATPAEFEQAKTNLYRTQVALIQAHYEYLLRDRILIFYQTNRL